MKNNILIVKDWKIKHKKDIKPSDKAIAKFFRTQKTTFLI